MVQPMHGAVSSLTSAPPPPSGGVSPASRASGDPGGAALQILLAAVQVAKEVATLAGKGANLNTAA